MMRRKKIASLVLASVGVGGLSIVLGAGGCNLVVDSGGYQVVLEDGSTDGTILGPDTGSGEASLADTKLTDSGADTAPANDAPVEGDGAPGTCGSTIPPSTNTTFQQLLLSCVLDQGCNYAANTYSVGLCVTYNQLLTVSSQTKCESGATNCPYIETCTGESWIGCDAAAPGWSCNSNHATYCYPASSGLPGVGDYNDCTKAAGTCETYIDTANLEGGVTAGCEVLSSCPDPDDGTYYCSSTGNFEYTCIDKLDGGTVGVGNSCDEYSATCSEEGGTGCYYLLPSCDPTSTAACDTTNGGQVGQQCYPNGLQRFDCAAAGLVCSPVADTFTGYNFQCIAPGCDPTLCKESCSGTVATFCVGGAPVTFDCATTSPAMTCIDTGVMDENTNDYVQCRPF
jgi:hypothetical protein